MYLLKKLTLIAIFSSSILAFGQQISWDDWEKESKTNSRLLPKYGHIKKTTSQLNADNKFLSTVLEKDTSRRKASEKFIQLGFQYLYKDIKTAMYRFNQAYLLDSTNTNIFWGYGAIYMVLGQIEKGKDQYEEGLSINPNNPHLLTDYGTYFLGLFYNLKIADYKSASKHLNKAATLLKKSYDIDPKDPNTSYKLSIIYLNKEDCDNALIYYDACKALGGQPISPEYTTDINKTCKR